MGLDMYLESRPKRRDEVFYWRKANAINKWFGDHISETGEIENLRDYPIDKDAIIALREDCKAVLEKAKLVPGKVINGMRLGDNGWENIYEDGLVISNPEVCDELMPTQRGFFYGSTDYNEWYLDDIRETLEMCEKLLEDFDFENNELVYSIWY